MKTSSRDTVRSNRKDPQASAAAPGARSRQDFRSHDCTVGLSGVDWGRQRGALAENNANLPVRPLSKCWHLARAVRRKARPRLPIAQTFCGWGTAGTHTPGEPRPGAAGVPQEPFEKRLQARPTEATGGQVQHSPRVAPAPKASPLPQLQAKGPELGAASIKRPADPKESGENAGRQLSSQAASGEGPCPAVHTQLAAGRCLAGESGRRGRRPGQGCSMPSDLLL